MAESAKNRIKAIGSQLAPLPAIKKVAPDFNSQRLAGKVVIVTGANSAMGIGRASAHQFAQNGAKAVYICDFDGSNLEAYKAEINASWPSVEVHTREMDAADEKSVKEVIDDALSRYGRLDVFFANAGRGGPMASFVDIDVDDFQEVMRVNLIGPFLAAKYAAPAMRKTSAEKPHSSGSIIMTASVAGIRANAGPTPYSASKAAVISMVQTIAFQLAGSNIRVNALLPGLIETGMTGPLFDAARQRGTENKVGQLNPLKRAGNADEIARVAAFLGSDESSYVNGQAWAVDGGLSAGHPFARGEFVNK